MRALIPVTFTLAAVLTSLGQLDGIAHPTQRDLVTPSDDQLCDAAHREACERIALLTGGQCASPRHLGGCRFDSLSYR